MATFTQAQLRAKTFTRTGQVQQAQRQRVEQQRQAEVQKQQAIEQARIDKINYDTKKAIQAFVKIRQLQKSGFAWMDDTGKDKAIWREVKNSRDPIATLKKYYPNLDVGAVKSGQARQQQIQQVYQERQASKTPTYEVTYGGKKYITTKPDYLPTEYKRDVEAAKYTYFDEQGRGYTIDPSKAPKQVETQQQVPSDINPQTGRPYGVVEAVKTERGLEGVKQRLESAYAKYETAERKGTLGIGGTIATLGLGFAGSFVDTAIFGKKLVTQPVKTIKETGTGLKNVFFQAFSPKGERLPQLGQALYEKPVYSTGFLAGEITQAKLVGAALEKSTTLAKKAATRLSPVYTPLKDSKLAISPDLTIKVIRKLPREPLTKQVTLAGKEITAVSGARDLFSLFKRKIIVNKQIPNAEKLSASSLRQLKKVDTLSPAELSRLNQQIIKETGSKGILETSFFADPYTRLRPSRLGIEKQKTASYLDYLSDDVTFRKVRPQAIVFEKVKVEKFPSWLKDVELKLKRGLPLTPSEEARLLKWQQTASGQFKPVGFLSRESEVTLAPTEIFAKQKTIGRTFIKGEPVEIIAAKIGKVSKRTTELLEKGKRIKLNAKETAELTSRLQKETGLSYGVSPAAYLSPSRPVGYSSRLFPRRTAASYKVVSSPLSTAKYIPSLSPASKPTSPTSRLIPYKQPSRSYRTTYQGYSPLVYSPKVTPAKYYPKPVPRTPRLLPQLITQETKERKYPKRRTPTRIITRGRGYELKPTLTNILYKAKPRRKKRLSEITGFEVLR